MIALLLADTLTLTPQKVRELAEAQAPSVLQAEAKVREAEGQLQQAGASFLPQLTLSAGYTYNSFVQRMTFEKPNMDTFPPTIDTITIEFGRHDNYQLQAKLGYLLFDWGRGWNLYWASWDMLKAAKLSVEAERRKAVSQALQAFWGAVAAREALKMTEEYVANLRRHYEDAKRMYQKGVASEAELLQAEVKLRNEEPQVTSARTAFERALDGLKLALNLPQETELRLEAQLDTTPPELSLDSLIQKALANRKDLKALRLQAKALERMAGAQNAGDKPQLVGFVAYTRQRPLGFEDEWGDVWTAGVSLSWNVFDGLLTRGKVKSANAQLEQVRLALKVQEEVVKNQVRSAWKAYREALDKLRSAEATVELAQRGLELTERAYKNGLMRQLDVYDAELNLLRAKVNLLAAKAQLRAALAQLEEAVGGE